MALYIWIAIAMIAFAANSLLCRLALSTTDIDPVSFTTLRLCLGAVTLVLLSNSKKTTYKEFTKTFSFSAESIAGGCSLFIYAMCFSIAYVSLSTGTGALLLFGTVQTTIIVAGLINNERLNSRQCVGFTMAIVGVIVLMLPSTSPPSMSAAMLMVLSGLAWGIYTLYGKQSKTPMASTTTNFILGTLLATVVFIVNLLMAQIGALNAVFSVDVAGSIYALLSGAFASACGYVLWYHCLSQIKATTAALVQLSVPVIAILMGGLFLHEPITLFIVVSCAMTVLGIYVAREKQQ